jgi:hypothetical protein
VTAATPGARENPSSICTPSCWTTRDSRVVHARGGACRGAIAKLAFRRAADEAFMWPEEALDIDAAGRSLTELPGIVTLLGRRIHEWIESSPKIRPPRIPSGVSHPRPRALHPGKTAKMERGAEGEISRCTPSGAMAVAPLRKWLRRRSSAATNT